MKVLCINAESGRNGGPANIATDICQTVEESGNECVIAYARYSDNNPLIQTYKIGNEFDIYMHLIKSRLFDKHGLGSKKATESLVSYIRDYRPDVINLHNIHGYYINYQVLFDYIKVSGVPVVWTLHDCWSFTGHCAYFDRVGCEKWKTGCYDCEQIRSYPKTILFDYSQKNYLLKKNAFTSAKNVTIVTPSKWLEDIAKESFLGVHQIRTIYNGIDLNIFKPIENTNELKSSKKITVLSVASTWEERKGLNDIIEVARLLDDDYQVMIVGLSKEQIQMLPNNVIGIPRTKDIQELVGYYSDADIFLNASVEDNLPTVIIEALACGTPVVTYDTGGCREEINSECGCLVKQHDVNGLVEGIRKLGKKQIKNECLKQARKFDMKARYKEYLDLFLELTNTSLNR